MSLFGNLIGKIGPALGGSDSLSSSVAKLANTQLGALFDTPHPQHRPQIHRESFGHRIEEINIQGLNDKRPIPIVFGRAKLAGNIIWTSPIIEKSSNHQRVISHRYSEVIHTHTDYNYFINFAIAICEGEVHELISLTMDDTIVNIHGFTHRFYHGTGNQEADPLIKNIAFRGTCYIVFENFPLSQFGNRIPNMIFEVQVKDNKNAIASKLNGITIVPGSGEFVYGTTAVFKFAHYEIDGQRFRIGKGSSQNQQLIGNETNLVHAIRNLRRDLPNLGWVAPVIGWFLTNPQLDSPYQFGPAVEYQDKSYTEPYQWSVAQYNRSNARLIGHSDGKARYGGTPADRTVTEMLEHLKRQGYKVMLNPMFFVDDAAKTWRGRVTGSPKAVKDFIDGPYSEFILHYAQLTKDLADAICIGSELIGITSVQSDGSYPAVMGLKDLAKKVKKIVGPEVIVTYAADWSEYHHDSRGYYHLDDLWAEEAIDVVAIDAYFPLSDSEHNIYNPSELAAGMNSGEGYDFYFEEGKDSFKRPLSPAYAWKNIRWWWENQHINPNGKSTAWKPKMKKIWFAEFGFPSVDHASNQPNVFYSPSSKESGFPHMSEGTIDLRAQSAAIEAMLDYCNHNRDMIELEFLWCWDARPYPSWPARKDIWADYDCYWRGHWVQGKLGSNNLQTIINSLCTRAGVNVSHLQSTNYPQLTGAVYNFHTSIGQAIDELLNLFNLCLVEKQGEILVTHRDTTTAKQQSNLGMLLDEVLHHHRDFHKSLSTMHYLDLTHTAHALHQLGKPSYSFRAKHNSTYIPLVMGQGEARAMHEELMLASRLACNSISFSTVHNDLNPGELILIDQLYYEITEVASDGYKKDITAVNTLPKRGASTPSSIDSSSTEHHNIKLQIYSIVHPENSQAILLGVVNLLGELPPLLIRSANNIDIATIHQEATIIHILQNLPKSLPYVWQEGIRVFCEHDDLDFTSSIIALGEELIYISSSTRVAQYHYVFHGAVRGHYNSSITSHENGKNGIRIDSSLAEINSNLTDNELHICSPFSQFSRIIHKLPKKQQEIFPVIILRLSQNHYYFIRQRATCIGLDYVIPQAPRFIVYTKRGREVINSSEYYSDETIISATELIQ